MLSRRDFLKIGGVVGAGALLSRFHVRRAFAAEPVAGGTLAPGDVDKFVLPLVKPPAMPPSKITNNNELYKIAVRQFQQRILSPPHPVTTVWSYGSVDNPGPAVDPATGALTGGTFNYPAFTIEATANRMVSVEWRNELVDPMGNYLPHLLPVDPTLHWANPPGGKKGRDRRPSFASTPGPYTGPVPMVTHVHGAHTTEESDGYAEAWWLPAANNIPKGYAETGTFYDYFMKKYKRNWDPGTASFNYMNDQPATTLWYHDHTLGMTRLNVYAGPAGFWLVRNGAYDLDLGYVAPGVGDSPLGEYTEIPIAIQDRSFNADGSLFYPGYRTFFDGYTGSYIPDTPVSPIWNPEFFGNMMVVNGFTWPFLEVEQRRYRFRFLNGCNSRFLILKTDNGMPFYQIGSDQGFLPETVQLNELLMAPAERADVIMDFTNISVDTEIILLNLGPDEPFGGGAPGVDFDPADPSSTGLVMKFRVKASTSPDTSILPTTLPAADMPGLAGVMRDMSLNEEAFEDEAFPEGDGPIAALLGTLDSYGNGNPLLWMDPVTENPAVGATEEWAFHNFTADAHPIHIHQVHFEVVDREISSEDSPNYDPNTDNIGEVRPSEDWETGYKDTVIAYPGEITRVKALYDLPGLYVWHCHIVEHEDNEMMRPFHVGPGSPV